ncbi:hypothetical protein IFM89_000613 [Coptis chinensis]|uniref:Amino acid transporter transmembrane domain-containing protein n=1 Tax=Coptis chinensis TaxID=261450 RepID=A0A835LI05_9MAGN|nr:hypothetical protein IFM89_000613 [Coptis chinensis]
MKDEEQMGHDRGIQFETDDEGNQAEDDFDIDDYASSSIDSSYNALPSSQSILWPQSYRQSIDMYSNFTPPTVSFLAGSSLGISSSFLSISSPHRRHQISESDSALNKPFLPSTATLDKEEPPLPPSKHASCQAFSYPELPPTQQCSYTQAVLNGVNVLCGMGLLSTPYAVKEGGWMSLWILLMYAAMSCYTGILLKRCLESCPGLQTYPDIGQAAFGLAARFAIAIILYAELYACCVEFIILMSDNLSALYPNVHMNFSGVHLNSHYIFAIATTLLVLPTVWLRNLSLLSYLSVGGVVASILVMICLLWVGVVDGVGFHPSGTAVDLVNLPVALGIYGFCFSGHSVFPNIYSSMKEPSQFPKVLIFSFIICFLLYTGVAVCGVWMFGDAIQSQFTLNMPKSFVASKIAVWTTIVNPISKYALTLTPVALSLEELWPYPQLKSHMVSVFIRTVLVLSTLVVALTVPFFSENISYLLCNGIDWIFSYDDRSSHFAMCLLSQNLPWQTGSTAGERNNDKLARVPYRISCSCFSSVDPRTNNLYLCLEFQIAACIFIIIVGVISSFVGTYSAIKKIVDEMS